MIIKRTFTSIVGLLFTANVLAQKESGFVFNGNVLLSYDGKVTFVQVAR